MTARTSGGLIAHLGYKVGGFPLCKSRMACAVVTADDTKGYQICKRCEKRHNQAKEIKAKREAKAS